MIIDDFWLFALTGLLLNLTPGNDMLYVIARSTGQGVKAGIISALGIGAGCIVHILAAVAGLSALLAQSVIAFEIIKYAGAAYLVYLGIRTLAKAKNEIQVTTEKKTLSCRTIFWQGVLTNVLNPKVALFFLAFLPQFIHAKGENLTWQILFLGTWFNVVGTLVNVLVAILFGRIAMLLSGSNFLKWQERITGLVLIGLGIRIALSSKQ